jgi:hypothetical protein
LTENNEEEFFEMQIFFSKASEKVIDKKNLFDKILSLIKQNKESLGVKIRSNKREKKIIMSSDNFLLSINFGKEIMMNFLIFKPDENIEIFNNVGNNIINYMNTILEDNANNPLIGCIKFIPVYKKNVNLAKKIISESRIVEINNVVEQVLNPISISLEYQIDDRGFLLSFNSIKEKTNISVATRIYYKEKLTYNVMQEEYNELKKPLKILDVLIESELL